MRVERDRTSCSTCDPHSLGPTQFPLEMRSRAGHPSPVLCVGSFVDALVPQAQQGAISLEVIRGTKKTNVRLEVNGNLFSPPRHPLQVIAPYCWLYHLKGLSIGFTGAWPGQGLTRVFLRWPSLRREGEAHTPKAIEGPLETIRCNLKLARWNLVPTHPWWSDPLMHR